MLADLQADSPNREHIKDSYRVEQEYYRVAAERAREGGLAIPRLILLEGGDCAFCFLMEDLRGTHPGHPGFLPPLEARAALDWLASFHALHWEGELPKGLWEHGSFWTLEKKNNAEKATQMSKVRPEYPSRVTANRISGTPILLP